MCDGLGATVKSSCNQGVLSGKAIIGKGKDLFEYREKRLKITDKVHSKREFVFVDSDTVIRDGPECRVQTQAAHCKKCRDSPSTASKKSKLLLSRMLFRECRM